MTLTIINVDGGFSIGSNKVYTLNVYGATPSPSPSPARTVEQFSSASSSFMTGTDSSKKYDIWIPVERSGGDTSALGYRSADIVQRGILIPLIFISAHPLHRVARGQMSMPLQLVVLDSVPRLLL